MGASKSLPIWLNPDQTPAEYDAWGYMANMAAPPQYSWSELYVEGIPDHSEFDPAYVKGKQGYNRYQEFPVGLVPGQQNDRLAAWAQPQYQLGLDNVPPNGEPMRTHPYDGPKAIFPQWRWQPSVQTCNPLNFPNCDMTDFSSRPAVKQWTNWWGATCTVPNANQPGTHATQWSLSSSKPKVNPVEWYIAALDRAEDAYASNQYENLAQVNSEDTSNYDPCAGDSLIEQVIPFLFGGAALYLENVYLAGVFGLLPETSKLPLQIGTFATVFFMGKGIVDHGKLLEDEGPEKILEDEENASTALAMTFGIVLASFAAKEWQWDETYILPIQGGGALIGRLLQPQFLPAVKTAVRSAGLMAAVPAIMLRWINKFFCSIANAGMNACDDFGTEAGGSAAGFPDARRWDVPSLAARLTDIAAQDNGWSRDSPEARFVYRSLITNPSWLEAGTVDGETSLYSGDQGINPLGLIAPIEESGDARSLQSDLHGWQWWQDWKRDTYSWTGEKSKDESVKTQNLYACQNFDLLWNASDCGVRDQPACAINRPDNSEDIQISQRMRDWLQAAVDKTADPTNLAKAYKIPGLSIDSSPPPQDELPAVQDFLNNAQRDETVQIGIGFNSVEARGEFAQYYLQLGALNLTAVQEEECIANSLFQSHETLQGAWDWATQAWDQQDQIALVHMWYRYLELDWGALQRASFKQWENGYTAAWDFFLKHPVNRGFTGEAGTLRRLQVPIVSSPISTQPIVGDPIRTRPPFDPFKPTVPGKSPPIVSSPISLQPPDVSVPIGLKPGSVSSPIGLGPGSVSDPIGLGPPLSPVDPITQPEANAWAQQAAAIVGQGNPSEAEAFLLNKGFPGFGTLPPAGSPWLKATPVAVAMAYVIIHQGEWDNYGYIFDVLQTYGFDAADQQFGLQMVSCAMLGSNSLYPISSLAANWTPNQKQVLHNNCYS